MSESPVASEELLQQAQNVVKASFSQTGEDMVLAHIFGDQPSGFFVDVGAFHPVNHSNTLYFYLRGWSGLNIDPTPGSMESFRRLRDRDINCEIGISSEAGEMEFFEFNEPTLNSFNRELSEYRNSDTETFGYARILKTVTVNTIPLAQLLNDKIGIGPAIDFMTIDVEGFELSVLQSNDWDKYNPRCLIIESFAPIEKIATEPVHKYISELGYTLRGKTVASYIYER